MGLEGRKMQRSKKRDVRGKKTHFKTVLLGQLIRAPLWLDIFLGKLNVST